MSSLNPELEHRLTKLELLQQNIESIHNEDRIFQQKLDSKLDDISIKIENLRFYEKTIEKMEKQVTDHEKKINNLFIYLKIMAGLIVVASGGSATILKVFLP